MTRIVRLAVAMYMVVLTLGLLAGHWYFEGPALIGADSHGVHLGDLVIVVATAIACVALVRRPREAGQAPHPTDGVRKHTTMR